MRAASPHPERGQPEPALARGKRERTKTRNRAAILEAARSVFARLGFDAASVRDIVRATDLSVGTFYQYFDAKDAVFLAVVSEPLKQLRERLRAVRRDPARPFEDRIHAAFLAFFEFVSDERALFAVLERNAWNLERHFEDLNLALQELREDLLPDLAGGDADPDDVAAAMIGTGLMVARQRLARGSLDVPEAARFCTQFSLAGLPCGTHRSRRTA